MFDSVGSVRPDRSVSGSVSAISIRLLLPVAALALGALAGCGGSSKESTISQGTAGVSATTTTQTTTQQSSAPPATLTSPSTVSASAGSIVATMHAGPHHPRVNEPWPVSFQVAQAGRPARASVRYEYLFGGQVVARRSHYTFTGRFHDVFMWPSSALGYPLTFRAMIQAGGQTLNLDYRVQVIR